VVGKSRRLGRVLLVSLALYGASAILLAQAPLFTLAILAALLLGAFDAMATTIRHAAVQIETPDELRGRVSAFYQMSSRGGPAIGDVVVGAAAGILGPVTALTVGGIVPAVIALGYLSRPNRVRDYAGVAEPEEAVDAEENPDEALASTTDASSPRPAKE
jgi:MFS family permease